MSGYKRVNFYELCRLCAQSIQDEKTFIFQDKDHKRQMQNKIKLCLSLNVNEDDFLPKVVCQKCIKRLEACNTFREECVNSESMLSSYFKNFRQTEDFKKSGKVYIKDNKLPSLIPEAVSSTTLVTSIPVAASNPVNLKTNLDAQFYTVQLPTLVPNPNLVNPSPKLVKNDKMGKVTNIQSVQTTQQQLAYNINLLNATLKNSVQQLPKELLSNVLVNANGEVIKITSPTEMESTILNALKIKQDKNRKKVKEVSTPPDENIVKIDLTDDNEPVQEEKPKLPHIKSTNQIYNMKSYQNSFQQFNSSQNATSKLQNIQNFNATSQLNISKFQAIQNIQPNTQNLSPVQGNSNSQNLNASAQDLNSLSGSTQTLSSTTQIQPSKYVTTTQNPTVILPISEFQNNFAPYHYTQQNLTNITNNNVTNVICNTSNVDSTINTQDLQSNTSYNNSTYIPVSNVIQMSNNGDTSNVCDNVNASNQTENQNVCKSEPPLEDTKIHKCDVCPKRFKRREHLYQHIKLHTGFRPYKCNTCQKSFMRKEHMLRHMTLHSGIRKFECELCGKCFSRNDNLLKHKKTHYKRKSFSCEICKKTFVMKHYYTQHVQKGCFMDQSEGVNKWEKE